MYNILNGQVFSFLLGVYLAVEFLGHLTILYFIIWETTTHFTKVTAPSYTPQQGVQVPVWLRPPWHWLLSDFVALPILVCVSDITLCFRSALPYWLMVWSIFPCAYGPFIFFSWRNIYWSSLPMFLVFFFFIIIEL